MQSNTQARVGYGQGCVKPAGAVGKTIVRVRTGTSVQRGEFIGGEAQPRAFVWQDEPAATPTREIYVRAEYEGCLWENGSPLDLKAAFPQRKDVAKLAPPLADWHRYYVKQASAGMLHRFWWGRFHEDGLRLARRLQALLIDDAVVRYIRPTDDPQHWDAAEIAL